RTAPRAPSVRPWTLRLPTLATAFLEQSHNYRGEYERVVQLATDNLAVLPADWVYEFFGAGQPASVADRCWLMGSLATLGRFADAAEPEAETIRIAARTQHADTSGLAHDAACEGDLLSGDCEH